MSPLRLLTTTLLCTLVITVHAQLSISATDTDYTIDFDNTLAGVNLGVFAGLGLIDVGISAGQLDSKAWSITGMSDGDVAFGGTGVTGDFSRTTTTGGASTGGLYAVNTNTVLDPDFSLGVQPTADDMTPGSIRLKLLNSIAATTIKTLTITYDVYVYNDQGRSSTLDLAYSSDNLTYYTISSRQTQTVEIADGSPAWSKTTVTKKIYGLNWANADPFYLAWQFDDLGGSGSRDEIAIDNIKVNVSDSNPDLLITEIMYSPNSTEPNYEWIELYNNSSESVNLEEFIFFDNSGAGTQTVLGPNFTLAASTGVILHNNTISSTDFKALWETGENIPAIAINLPELTNTGKTIGLWGNRAYFDNGNTTNAINALSFQNGAASWPSVGATDGASIYLTSLAADNTAGSNWSMSLDAGSSPVGTAYTVTSITGGGSRILGAGSDTGSPYAGVPLPVTWLSFEGKVMPQKTILYWSTALEINNQYFKVEKSLNGKQWTEIGKVPGKGTFYTESHYSYELEEIQRPYYFRITQVDFDGKQSSTKLIQLSPGNRSVIKAFPTLLDSKTPLNITVTGLATDRVYNIQVRSITGRMVYDNRMISTGEISQVILPLSLPQNTYFLQITEGSRPVYKTRILLR